MLGEADVKWSHGPFSAKALGSLIAYPDAGNVNAAYGKNLPTGMYGYYAEAAYDLLYHQRHNAQLFAFARLESFDLASSVPAPPRGIADATLAQRHIIAGLNFMPIPNIAIKADVRLTPHRTAKSGSCY